MSGSIPDTQNTNECMNSYCAAFQKEIGVYLVVDSVTHVLEPNACRYIKYKKNERCSPNTIKGIAFGISYYLSYLKTCGVTIELVYEMRFSDQHEHFSSFLNWLSEGQHTSNNRQPDNNTCNTYLSKVFGYLQFLLVDQRYSGDLKVLIEKTASYINDMGLRFSRTVKCFKGYLPSNEHVGRDIEKDKIAKLIDACNNTRDKLLLMLLTDTGMRIGELLGINYVQDIDYDKRSIHVEQREENENKARAKYAEYRDVYFSKETLAVLQLYLAENASLLSKSEYLFIVLMGKTAGSALNASAVYSVLEKLKRRTGIKVTPHMIRHCFANVRRKHGWSLLEISRALGHKNIRTTEAYLNVNSTELAVASEQFFATTEGLYDISKLI